MPPGSHPRRRVSVLKPSSGWLLVLAALATGVSPSDLRAQEGESAPSSLVVSEVQGQVVRLSWDAPAAAPPDLYLLEGGAAPGQVLASLPVAGSASSLAFTLAPGAYYARLHALRNGVRSPASNEVRISVGLDEAPAAPQDVAALALGADVSLSWRSSFEGGAVDGVVVDVAGPISASLPLPPTGQIAFGDVPWGTYTLTFRARNGSGVTSTPVPVTLTVPGATIQPLVSPKLPAGAARLQVRYENYLAPRLDEFRQREHLDAVVQGATGEFDAMLRLKDWVAAQFPMSSPSPYPPWDAMTILDWIRAGYTGGFCGQYSQIFLQALAAYGVPARYLEVGTDTNPYNHYTTEVWSNDFNKWVLLDVAFNNHFVRGGVPLSAVELRDAKLQNRLGEVEVVLGAVRAGHPSPFDYPQRSAELYHYIRFHLNANHVSAPNELPFERYLDMVEWLDGQTIPWELSTTPSEFPHERPTAVDTADRTLVDWAPNQVWIAARRTGVMQVTLDLEHSVLQHSHYQYRVIDADGAAGPWATHTGNALVWTVKTTDRVFQVRGVNLKGITGTDFVSPSRSSVRPARAGATDRWGVDLAPPAVRDQTRVGSALHFVLAAGAVRRLVGGRPAGSRAATRGTVAAPANGRWPHAGWRGAARHPRRTGRVGQPRRPRSQCHRRPGAVGSGRPSGARSAGRPPQRRADLGRARRGCPVQFRYPGLTIGGRAGLDSHARRGVFAGASRTRRPRDPASRPAAASARAGAARRPRRCGGPDNRQPAHCQRRCQHHRRPGAVHARRAHFRGGQRRHGAGENRPRRVGNEQRLQQQRRHASTAAGRDAALELRRERIHLDRSEHVPWRFGRGRAPQHSWRRHGRPDRGQHS